MIKTIVLLLVVLNFSFASATKIFIGDTYIPENFYKYDKYFKKAARKYNIPVYLLKAISLTENSRYKADLIGTNKNKTKDYGLMQINSIHLKRYNITEEEIIKPFVNIDIAARLLSEHINRDGFNWHSIGKYHSANEKYKNIWLNKVSTNLTAIILKESKRLFMVEKLRALKLVSLLDELDKDKYETLVLK